DLDARHVDDLYLDIFGAFPGEIDSFIVDEADRGLQLTEGDIGGIFFVEDAADAAMDALAKRERITLGLIEIVTADHKACFRHLRGEFDGRAERDRVREARGDDLLAGQNADG